MRGTSAGGALFVANHDDFLEGQAEVESYCDRLVQLAAR